MNADYGEADFGRAVAAVGAEREPRVLVERLGVAWDELACVAHEAAAAVLVEQGETSEAAAGVGAEAFTAGFLVGAHLPEAPCAVCPLADAVAVVQARGRHAVVAEWCDLAGVAGFETAYAEALVGSAALAGVDGEVLGPAFTRLFEFGLATGLALRAR